MHSPFLLIKIALKEAQETVMNSNGWSERTFYRKIKDCRNLTETEQETIAQAMQNFSKKIIVHEPPTHERWATDYSTQ